MNESEANKLKLYADVLIPNFIGCGHFKDTVVRTIPIHNFKRVKPTDKNIMGITVTQTEFSKDELRKNGLELIKRNVALERENLIKKNKGADVQVIGLRPYIVASLS